MKKFKSPDYSVSLLILILLSSVCSSQSLNSPDQVKMNAIHLYRDGYFEGKSCASYKGEPYWGLVRIKIEGGIFSEVGFIIRDTSLHEYFNKKYAVHFKGNSVYIRQCKKDSKGMKSYPKKLSKTQDIEQVDAMTGATWSYNIFKASVNEALKNAYNIIEIAPSH
jgi:major membrane immunogen (membrane-anchored lipoprotein)